MSDFINIAVDAMGGDGSPKKIIDGIILNHSKNKNNFFKIFGDKNKIHPLIEGKISNEFYEIIHTEKHSTDDYIVYIEYYRKNSRGLVKTKKETYHPNGVMSSELYFRLGKIHGLNRGWYEDGTIGFEYSYKNGKEDGKWIEWYSNGQKSIEGTMKNGKRDGLWIHYWDDGKKGLEVIYKEGELISEKDFK